MLSINCDALFLLTEVTQFHFHWIIVLKDILDPLMRFEGCSYDLQTLSNFKPIILQFLDDFQQKV